MLSVATSCVAQTPASRPAQRAAKLSFDVVSVRENKSGGPATGGDKPSSNVPLGPGNVYSPTGGFVSVKNYTLLSYILFAYRMTDGQLARFREMAPAWVMHDRFNIEARTSKTDVTKDELRLMFRSLLAERFNLAVHYEARSVAVYGLTVAKPGTLGPKLRPHVADSDCPTTVPKKADPSAPSPPETTASGLPATCGGIILLPVSSTSRYKIGGRDVSMSLIANSLGGWGGLGRPVVDRTGLQATYDFTLDFAPLPALDSPAASDDWSGPTFPTALQKQLGLKLEPQKGNVEVLILDHIDHLIPN